MEQALGGGGNPGQPSATTGTLLFLAWVALQLNEVAEPLGAQLTPHKFGHLCCRGNGGDHPHPARAQAFTLKLGHACFEELLFPAPSSFSTRVPPPPVLSFLHSFLPFLIASPQLPEMAARQGNRGEATGLG